MKENNKIVVYYSYTGHTKMIAKDIEKKIELPYSGDRTITGIF